MVLSNLTAVTIDVPELAAKKLVIPLSLPDLENNVVELKEEPSTESEEEEPTTPPNLNGEVQEVPQAPAEEGSGNEPVGFEADTAANEPEIRATDV